MPDDLTTERQRAFPRLVAGGHIRYQVLSSLPESLAVAGVPAETVRNISGGGVRFHSPEPVLPGAFVAVELQVPALEMPVLALGRVVACEPPALGEGHCDVAVEFLWTGWADGEVQQGILELLRRALED